MLLTEGTKALGVKMLLTEVIRGGLLLTEGIKEGGSD